MYLKSTKYRSPHLDSAVYIINHAAQIQQISAGSDRDVRHAEKVFSAGVIRIWFFGNQQGRLKAFLNLLPFDIREYI